MEIYKQAAVKFALNINLALGSADPFMNDWLQTDYRVFVDVRGFF